MSMRQNPCFERTPQNTEFASWARNGHSLREVTKFAKGPIGVMWLRVGKFRSSAGELLKSGQQLEGLEACEVLNSRSSAGAVWVSERQWLIGWKRNGLQRGALDFHLVFSWLRSGLMQILSVRIALETD